MTNPVTVTASDGALGAEVTGVDVKEIDDRLFRTVHEAWLAHQVLLFRDQRLRDEDLITFSSRFGTLEHAPIQENGRRFVEGHPEILAAVSARDPKAARDAMLRHLSHNEKQLKGTPQW